MPGSNSPDISVIIVSYNVSELLDACLRTLKEYTKSVSYEVIVVDSASSDDSVEMVAKKYPWVTLIASEVNVGFTKGNNMGLEKAVGKDILYLNPDVELIEDVIGPMLGVLEERKGVGVVGPKLLNTDRSLQGTIGFYTSLRSVVKEFVLREQKENMNVIHPEQPTSVQVLLGACLLVRGDVAREIGGFDERYFMYNEETDLCLSFKKRGYDTLYYPEVAIIHHGSKSATKTPEIKQRSLHIARVSMLTYLHKHYGFLTALVGKLIVSLSLLVRMPILLVKLLTSKREDARLKIRYYFYTIRWILTKKRVGY
ncbi:MAG TPA: glycosyltransferase family 2 protein [Verrucomicrobiae bacterium]|nr:glycosyltransferase family 2 protein [Verrucomicrobiae bacterium]